MTHQLRVLSHNLGAFFVNDGRSPNTVQTVVDQAASFNADVLFLQEVTTAQFDTLVAALPQFAFAWTQMHTLNALPKGQALASRYGIDDVVRTPLGAPDGTKQFFLTHARTILPDGSVARVATTHLRVGSPVLARKRQAQVIAATLAPYVDKGEVVCVGGDFNNQPTAEPLDLLYAVTGGDFYECDQTDSSNTEVQDGDPTTAIAKYDYIFFSARSCATTTLSGGQVVNPASDHLILRGLATVTQAPPLY